MTQTMGLIERVANASTTFDLYRNGAVTGTYPLFSLRSGMPSAAGAQEIHSSYAYGIGGVAGSTQAVISFDTSKSDRNPPMVSRFRIEQNGIRTATPSYPSANSIAVKFRATDVNLASVALEWRQSGTTTWTPLTLGGGTRLRSPAAAGRIGRLACDDHGLLGKHLSRAVDPALITKAPGPPGAPASVTATRSGTAAISVSWAPAASDAAITGYRIERIPGNQTVTTSGTGTTFVDTNGLVPGSAYFYRIIAIDTEDAASTPSAYDVATLIQFADDPVTPGQTGIRGVHVADLRLAIDAVRQAAGLGKTWTDYSPATGVVNASHFLELRDRLNEARAVMSLPAVQLSDSVAVGATVRARTVKELREGVK